jgi:hypothetical protein
MDASPWLMPRPGEDALDPALHLLRGAPGKGEEQDAARIGSLTDEMSDTMRKRLGLAGTRPRNDQQGPAARAVLRSAGLIRVEVCKTVRWRHGSELRSIPKIKMITIRSGPLCHTPQPAGLSHLRMSELCQEFCEEGVVPSGLLELSFHGAL